MGLPLAYSFPMQRKTDQALPRVQGFAPSVLRSRHAGSNPAVSMIASVIYRSLTSFMLRHQWIVLIAHLIPARSISRSVQPPQR